MPRGKTFSAARKRSMASPILPSSESRLASYKRRLASSAGSAARATPSSKTVTHSARTRQVYRKSAAEPHIAHVGRHLVGDIGFERQPILHVGRGRRQRSASGVRSVTAVVAG